MLIGRVFKIIRNKKKFKTLGNIGKNCEIDDSVNFGSEPYLIFLGNNVKMSFEVKIITHDGGVNVLRNLKEKYKEIDMFGPVVIKDNVFIGANTIIMPGVTIEKNSIIGAGSIITKSIPENSVVAGSPAKIICTIEEYEEKRKEKFVYTKLMEKEEKKEYIKKIIKNNPEKFLKK